MRRTPSAGILEYIIPLLYLPVFTIWVSATKQASHTHKLFLSVGISNKTSFSYPQTFLSVGISSKTSFPYPQTFHSVGISSKTSFPYPQTFIVWVSATKQASHTHKLFTLRQKKGTEKLDPISCAHVEAKLLPVSRTVSSFYAQF